MNKKNIIGMAVGCYLAAFKKDRRALLRLGFPSYKFAYEHANRVLDVRASSVKNWEDEFLPYWANSCRTSIEPNWLPSLNRGRKEGVKPRPERPSRTRMFKHFELMPETEFTSVAKALLNLGGDKVDLVVIDEIVKLVGDVASPVKGRVAMHYLVASGGLPAVSAPPVGNERPLRIKVSEGDYDFMRDPAVVSWALSRAKGICELCGSGGPFMGRDGYLFLEVHHLVPLSAGGSDTVSNVAAICPNCHRACHLAPDRRKLTRLLKDKVSRVV
jgi:hypothetical protein